MKTGMARSQLSDLGALLSPERIITDPIALGTYSVDAGLDRGRPDAVVFPTSTEDVQRIVRWAAGANVPLVARGAGTGLAGGAVAERGGVIVAMTRMDRLAIDPTTRRATVGPGVANGALDAAAARHGLMYAPDPASGRVSTLGGNVACNAGGPRCVKYGVTADAVTGLHVVLASGRALRLRRSRDSGPDLAALMIGSEGTLGIVTEIEVRLVCRPPAIRTILAAFPDIESAGHAVSAIMAAGIIPAALEMMDQRMIRIIEADAKVGLPLDAGAVLVADVEGWPEAVPEHTRRVSRLLRSHGAHEVRQAADAAEREALWRGRKRAGGAVARAAPAYYSVDVCVPRPQISAALIEIEKIIEAHDLLTAYLLHAGDGNLHPLLLLDPEEPGALERVADAGRDIAAACAARGGSISGEHGIGSEKREFMSLQHDNTTIGAMLDVKRALDPSELLNPGKIFPKEFRHGIAERGTDTDVPAATDSTALSASISPSSATEASAHFRMLNSSGRTARIVGARPFKGSTAAAAREPSVLISTDHLVGIQNLAVEDRHVTVYAGTPLHLLKTTLEEHDLEVQLDSPWPDDTLGDIIARGLEAPRSIRDGGLGAQLRCATLCLPDGRIIKAGRPVAKDVAGYDLAGLMVGSGGQLALIIDMTIRVSALPDMTRTLVGKAHDRESALLAARAALSLAVVADGLVVERRGADGPWTIAWSASGHSADVSAETKAVLTTWRAPELQLAEILTSNDQSDRPDQRWRAFLRDHATGRIKSGSSFLDIGAGTYVTHGDNEDFSFNSPECGSSNEKHSSIVTVAKLIGKRWDPNNVLARAII